MSLLPSSHSASDAAVVEDAVVQHAEEDGVATLKTADSDVEDSAGTDGLREGLAVSLGVGPLGAGGGDDEDDGSGSEDSARQPPS